MKLFKNTLVILISMLFFSSILFNYNCSALTVDDELFQKTIEEIYKNRNEAFLTGNIEKLKSYYNTSKNPGLWSYEHEIKRINYLRHWAKERGIEFTNVNSNINIKRVSSKGEKQNIFLEESYKFDYIYPDDPNTINSFGVGLKHTVNLVEKNDYFIIYSDWYTDCFEDALNAYTYDNNLDNIPTTNLQSIRKTNYDSTLGNHSYNRINAIEYANKYCGANFTDSENFKFNKKYNNHEGAGGDCTNFASQVLGDKEEGGQLPFDSLWFCKYKKYGGADGSAAFVNANKFKNYVLYSGKGKLIKKGTFKELTASTEDNPETAISQIEPGDLIAYEKKGAIDHFSIVTDIDSKGYPLVNSHTTNRYHVPWDLGWGDKNIKFNLIHIRD